MDTSHQIDASAPSAAAREKPASVTAQLGSSSASTLAGSPLGIAWFILYGYSGIPAPDFLPQLRELGAGFTKIYLFWQQLQPDENRFDWSALDTFVAQLKSPDEGLISLFSSSLWATQRPAAMLPPSPAKNPEDYYRFVFEAVSRCRGKVRYWQNDAEPNNPVFWAGTREEFVAQLKVFYRAVKAADPAAIVVVGGYDGLFVPPGAPLYPGQRSSPFPQQKEGLAFFDYVLLAGRDAFDLFDLRLYGDPYTIVARVDYMRKKMTDLGYEKPIICTEYGGPNFFEFAENRIYLPLISSWTDTVQKPDPDGNLQADAHSTNRIEELYSKMETLAPQTRMFMEGCGPKLEAKFYRILSRGLVMRNLFAFSARVEKTLYWQLLSVTAKRDDLMTLMYGKIGLLSFSAGSLRKSSPAADTFSRMAEKLGGLLRVSRIHVPDMPSVFLFEIERKGRNSLHVVWERRDAFAGEELPPTPLELPWPASTSRGVDIFGTPVSTSISEGKITLSVSLTPVYLEPSND